MERNIKAERWAALEIYRVFHEKLAEKMRILRDHGMNPNRRYWHDVIGFNYRMTNMQAAIGLAQLQKIDKFIEKKRQIAKWYEEGLKELAEKEMITLHPEMKWAKCVYWMYSILIEDKFGMKRDELMKKLEKNGIETRSFFYPMHTMPPYKSDEKFRVSEELAKKGVSFPSNIKLKENMIIEIVKNIYALV